MTTRSKSDKGVVRCAIYTRKSTEEGLEQEFNSLHAQRDSAEAFIASQRHEGWQCVPERFDDGGYTGGNTERPALQRLMQQIERGKIDCVVVYKVDRLSRSLLDFAKMMSVFEQHKVSFVSVTQQFNTATSMGRLILNVLLSFAQFEREMISERIRDKIAATRRKGKWIGGRPILGYRVENMKLLVDEVEAEQVRQIFKLFMEEGTLLSTVTELNRRGWTTKRWTARNGKQHGGQPFSRSHLHSLLTNVVLIGKIRYRDEIHPGEHQAIVPEELFRQVKETLRRNGTNGGASTRNKYGALLRGLLYCRPCDRPMYHAYTKKDNRHYRYYVCATTQTKGWQECPTKSVPAGELERFVVEQIKEVCRDPQLIVEVTQILGEQAEQAAEKLKREREMLERQLRDDYEKLKAATLMTEDVDRINSLVALHDKIERATKRVTELDDRIAAHHAKLIDESQVVKVLAEFMTLWDNLAPKERVRIVELLVERVFYDGENSNVSITFHAGGIKSLGRQLAQSMENSNERNGNGHP